jgi:HEPN domain-containing protein
MNEVVNEWVQKAEGDFTTALREWRARKSRNHDAVCFHAQQCIEKYIKAFLQQNQQPFTKTHDLVMLVKACLLTMPLWSVWIEEMDILTRYAVLFRYPGESATREESMRAVRIMRKYRQQLRADLGLN